MKVKAAIVKLNVNSLLRLYPIRTHQKGWFFGESPKFQPIRCEKTVHSSILLIEIWSPSPKIPYSIYYNHLYSEQPKKQCRRSICKEEECEEYPLLRRL